MLNTGLTGKKFCSTKEEAICSKQLVAMSKYKTIPGFGLVDKGRILLQDHGNKVYYKNIKIRSFKTVD
jgi:hypothetical protein